MLVIQVSPWNSLSLDSTGTPGINRAHNGGPERIAGPTGGEGGTEPEPGSEGVRPSDPARSSESFSRGILVHYRLRPQGGPTVPRSGFKFPMKQQFLCEDVCCCYI